MPTSHPPRPSWDETFFRIAQALADRSSCSRRHAGALLVQNKFIISSGYNGTPSGMADCWDGGCPRCSDPTIPSGEGYDRCVCLHAEQNTILRLARQGGGVDLGQGEVLAYTTFEPCLSCVKELWSLGVREIRFLPGAVFAQGDPLDTAARRVFLDAGMRLIPVPAARPDAPAGIWPTGGRCRCGHPIADHSLANLGCLAGGCLCLQVRPMAPSIRTLDPREEEVHDDPE